MRKPIPLRVQVVLGIDPEIDVGKLQKLEQRPRFGKIEVLRKNHFAAYSALSEFKQLLKQHHDGFPGRKGYAKLELYACL